MLTSEIISIITVSVTLLLGVLGFIFNSILQRKNNSINIITQSRLERRKETQDLFAELLAITDYDYYKTLNEEEKLFAIRKATDIVGKLVSKYTYSFPKDNEFIEVAKRLKKLFCEDNQDWKSIENARAEFEKNAVIYVYTEWKRIKLETVGEKDNRLNKLPKWEKIYDETEKYFEQNYKFQNSSNDKYYCS